MYLSFEWPNPYIVCLIKKSVNLLKNRNARATSNSLIVDAIPIP